MAELRLTLHDDGTITIEKNGNVDQLQKLIRLTRQQLDMMQIFPTNTRLSLLALIWVYSTPPPSQQTSTHKPTLQRRQRNIPLF